MKVCNPKKKNRQAKRMKETRVRGEREGDTAGSCRTGGVEFVAWGNVVRPCRWEKRGDAYPISAGGSGE